MEGERIILIHMIDSLTYNLPSIPVLLDAAKSETTTLQLELHHPYLLQVLANLQSMTDSNAVGVTQTYHAVAV